MPIIGPGGGGGGGLNAAFKSVLSGAAASIDTGATLASGNIMQIHFICRTSDASGNVNITLNGDTGAHYDLERVIGGNLTASANNAVAAAQWQFSGEGSGNTANYAASGIITIPGYSNTTFFKSGNIVFSTLETTGGGCIVHADGCVWRSTAAINQVTITGNAGNLIAGSALYVYTF